MRQFKFIGSENQGQPYANRFRSNRPFFGRIYNEDEKFDTNHTVAYWAKESYTAQKEWEEVVEEDKPIKKFKFLGDFEDLEDGSYGGFVIGGVYSLTDECPEGECSLEEHNLVKYYVEEYPNDWEEVIEQAGESVRKFKFVGTTQEADEYVYPVKVGGVYPDDYFKRKDSTIYLISEFTSYESMEWEDVTEKLRGDFIISSNENSGYEAPIPKIFTDAKPTADQVLKSTDLIIGSSAYHDFSYPSQKMSFWGVGTKQEIIKPKIFTNSEVVTLVTFLNDNFEEFKLCINEPERGGITWGLYNELSGEYSVDKATLLIDKIEKNEGILTDAEKVTLITFLNDNFEEFDNFINGELGFIYYWDLNGNGEEEASLLIDKIELL